MSNLFAAPFQPYKPDDGLSLCDVTPPVAELIVSALVEAITGESLEVAA